MRCKLGMIVVIAVFLSGCNEGGSATPTPIPTKAPLPVPTETPMRVEPVNTATSGIAPIAMKIIQKELHQANYSMPGDRTAINFDLEVTNNTGKNIRAYTGVLHFKDLFDRDFKKAQLTVEDGLSAGQTTTIGRSLDYNQYIDDDVRLNEIQLKDMSVEFVTEQIIFTDGTKQKFP